MAPTKPALDLNAMLTAGKERISTWCECLAADSRQIANDVKTKLLLNKSLAARTVGQVRLELETSQSLVLFRL